MTVPVLTIVGKSGSGKTMLMEKIIKRLREKGYAIGTLKHHSHPGFDIDKPGKDSWRHARAGSEHVIIAAPDKIASYRLLARELSFDEIIAEFSDLDLVLVEGYKSANQPAVEVIREDNGLELITDTSQRIAVAADVEASRLNLEKKVPVFDLDDTESLVEMIEERFLESA
mgnify:CR=1 FL=1